MASSGQQKFQILREREERSVLVKIKFNLYEISTEVLLDVFSACGNIETVEIFRSGEEFHSRVCFEDKDSAIRALDCYNGRCIYDFWCKLELFQGFQVPRLRKTEVPMQETKEAEIDDNPIIQESPRSVRWKVEAPLGSTAGNSGEELVGVGEYATRLRNTEEITNQVDELNDDSSAPGIEVATADEKRIEGPIEDVKQASKSVLKIESQLKENSKGGELMESSNSEKETNIEDQPIQVTPNPYEFMNCGGIVNGLAELVVLLIQLMEIRLANTRTDSFECLRTLSAHKVFVKMPKKGVHVLVGLEVDEWPSNLVSFGMRSVRLDIESSQELIKLPYDRGKSGKDALYGCSLLILMDHQDGLGSKHKVRPWREVSLVEDLIFDPGIAKLGVELRRHNPLRSIHVTGHWRVLIVACIGMLDSKILNFDPGGISSLILGKNSRVGSVGLIDVCQAWDTFFVFDPGGVPTDHRQPGVLATQSCILLCCSAVQQVDASK